VDLYPFGSDSENYEFWEKVGQLVGNLMKLQTFNIHFVQYSEDDDGNADEPDREILARILRYLRRKVALCVYVNSEEYNVQEKEIRDLARGI
jgi:hypothetical protein